MMNTDRSRKINNRKHLLSTKDNTKFKEFFNFEERKDNDNNRMKGKRENNRDDLSINNNSKDIFINRNGIAADSYARLQVVARQICWQIFNRKGLAGVIVVHNLIVDNAPTLSIARRAVSVFSRVVGVLRPRGRFIFA